MTLRPLALALLALLPAGGADAATLPVAPRLAESPSGPSLPTADPDAPASHDVVIVAHGMGRTRFSMLPLTHALEEAGFEVVNYGYPSRSASVAELGKEFGRRIALEEARPGVEHVHLVGHSLGTILIRWVMANQRPAHLGRVVMLAPPNRGSHRADLAAPWLSWLSAPLPELTTWDTSTVNRLPTPPDVPIGIIAGAHDGTVPVLQTFLDGPCLCDHVVVPYGHTFIMRHQLVHELTVSYLRTGSFFD